MAKQRINISLDDLLKKGKETGIDEAFLEYFAANLTAFGNDMGKAAQNTLIRMGGVDTGDLRDSIYGRAVTFKDGNAKVGIKFLEYGIYHNLGVGRGLLNIERSTGQALTSSRAAAGLSQRKANPFLDQTENTYHQKLSEFISTKAADFLAKTIGAALEDTVRIEL